MNTKLYSFFFSLVYFNGYLLLHALLQSKTSLCKVCHVLHFKKKWRKEINPMQCQDIYYAFMQYLITLSKKFIRDLTICHDFKNYPTFRCIEAVTVSSQDDVIHKTTAFPLNFTTLFQIATNVTKITSSRCTDD